MTVLLKTINVRLDLDVFEKKITPFSCSRWLSIVTNNSHFYKSK